MSFNGTAEQIKSKELILSYSLTQLVLSASNHIASYTTEQPEPVRTNIWSSWVERQEIANAAYYSIDQTAAGSTTRGTLDNLMHAKLLDLGYRAIGLRPRQNPMKTVWDLTEAVGISLFSQCTPFAQGIDPDDDDATVQTKSADFRRRFMRKVEHRLKLSQKPGSTVRNRRLTQMGTNSIKFLSNE